MLGGSSLEELFDAWGLTYASDRFVGDITSAAKVSLPSGGRAAIVDYIPWLELGPDQLNAKDVVTSQIRRITMGSVGALAPKEGATTQFTPLISSEEFRNNILWPLVTAQLNIGARNLRPDTSGTIFAMSRGRKEVILGWATFRTRRWC